MEHFTERQIGQSGKTGDDMNVPQDLKYTSSHEWVKIDGNIVTVGITDYAQSQLSDLTFIELPAVDDVFAASDEAGVLESVKAASDIYSPLSGKVVEVNESLNDNPEAINSDPYTEGWLFKLEMSDPDEVERLMDNDGYDEIVPD